MLVDANELRTRKSDAPVGGGVAAFARVVGGYWTRGFPRARREIASWRARAEEIPDPELRRLALETIAEKHRDPECAAAFATLAPPRLRPRAVRLLVAYESMFNYLDTLCEESSPDPLANARQLQQAQVVALTPGVEHPDYYAFNPLRDDGGYLELLVDTCRELFAGLPAYRAFAGPARRAAAIAAEGQSLNNAAGLGADCSSERWASGLTPEGSELRWWEVAAAACSSLCVHPLLAAAADPNASGQDADQIQRAYFPWVSTVAAMLDSLVDQSRDAIAGTQSAVAWYDSSGQAAERLGDIAVATGEMTRRLPKGDRHAVILTCLVGYYAATPEASTPAAHEAARRMMEAMGSLAAPARLMFRLRQATTSSEKVESLSPGGVRSTIGLTQA